MKKNTSKSILFIGSASLSHHIWEPWAAFFATQGYAPVVPPWPERDATAAQLRSKHPDRKIASLRLDELVEYYIKIILKMDELPTIIGHGLGGLIAQILIARRFGTAGIIMHSYPPTGIHTFRLSFYRSLLRAMAILSKPGTTYLMPFHHWQRDMTPGMEAHEQTASYQQFATPESKLIIRDVLTDAARIDFRRLHAPLLMISGSEDRIIPPSLNYNNFKRYTSKHSLIAYKEFEGSNHFMPGQHDWGNKAAYIAEWLKTINQALSS